MTRISPRIRRRSRLGVPAAAALCAAALFAGLAVGSGQAISQAAPTNTAVPGIAGSPVVGETITASNGTWTGSPTSYAYQWFRCDTSGANCSSINGATSSTYTLSDADVDRRLRARVTATNADGSASAQSSPSDVIRAASPPNQGAAPSNTKAPEIAGTPRVGQTLRASAGEWSGAQPITFSFQWLRCDANGASCVTIGGAADETYAVGDGDVDRTLRVRVTARNAAGSSSQRSAPTAKVAGPEGPSGAIRLQSGETSIPVSSVPANESLVVDQVVFQPNVIRSRTSPFQVRIKVKDTRGFVVRDALVFIRSTPLVTQRSGDRDVPTGQDGWASVTMVPERDFPELDPSYAVQFYVKAYRQGDPTLGGVAGTRLVQVPLGRS